MVFTFEVLQHWGFEGSGGGLHHVFKWYFSVFKKLIL